MISIFRDENMARSALGYTRFRNRGLCLDDLFSVDIREWKKDRVLDCQLFEYRWRRHQQAIGFIHFQFCSATDLVRYTLELKNVAKRSGQLSLIRTNCHFGGERFWFKCPRCERKVVKLYFHNRTFQCRCCCTLPYRSQNESASDRNIRRVRSVRRLLGASDNILDAIDSKPKGMHWRRFESLLDRAANIDHIEQYWNDKSAIGCAG
mgnify:CR=1 FL=1